MFTFKSRDARISGVWTLTAMTGSWTESEQITLTWNDNDCEDFNGDAFDETDTYTGNYSFSGGTLTTSMDATTTRDDIGVGCGTVSGGDWEDGNSFSYGVTYTYELTIKKNGTYSVKITYSVYDENQPLPADNDGDEQFGATFSGEYTGETSKWYWVDMDKNKEGITFENFPTIYINTDAAYEADLNNPGECDFDYYYLTQIGHMTSDMTFMIDQLKSKNLTLICDESGSAMVTYLTDEYESIDNNFGDVDCIETVNVNTSESMSLQWDFESDGKAVKE